VTDRPFPPAGPERSFKEHYRRLVLGSIRHSAESEHEVQLAMGHRLRARRAARRALAIDGLSAESPVARGAGGRTLETATRACLAATLIFVASSLVLAGVRSWWTGGGDLGLIALSFAWFFLASRERAPARLPVAAGAAAEGRTVASGTAPPPAG